jgi:DNA-binding transcriptional MerR regulator
MTSGRRLLIAQFARCCRLPVSTLRYYDSIALLRPANVDPVTGYRYYTEDQLPVAVTIAHLRRIGSDPRTIASVLAGGQEAATALAAERTRLTGEIAERTRALNQLGSVPVQPLWAGHEPVATTLAGGLVPGREFSADVEGLTAAITRSVATLRTHLRRAGISARGWGALLPLDLSATVNGVVFAHPDRSAEHWQRQDVRAVRLPHGPGWTVEHRGGYAELPFSYAMVLSAIETRGAVPRGPVLEYYGPDDSCQGAACTRVAVPVRSSEGARGAPAGSLSSPRPVP